MSPTLIFGLKFPRFVFNLSIICCYNDHHLQSICENEDYKYTYEKNRDWTPYNSNLHMQGIKVIVDNPVPENHQNPDSFEDTLLLDMVKEKRMKEMQERKVRTG